MNAETAHAGRSVLKLPRALHTAYLTQAQNRRVKATNYKKFEKPDSAGFLLTWCFLNSSIKSQTKIN